MHVLGSAGHDIENERAPETPSRALASLAGLLHDRNTDDRSQAPDNHTPPSHAVAAAGPKEILALVEQVARIGHWRLDTATGSVSWSDGVYSLHGLDRATFAPTLDNAIAAYHPDDRPLVTAIIAEAIADKGSYEFGLRIVRPDGLVRHVFCRGMCQVEADIVTALFGTIMDVTAIKDAEAQVRRSEARFRRLAETTSDVITRLGSDFRRDYVSPACEQVFGFTPEEMIGGRPSDSIHPDDVDAVREVARRLISGEIADERIVSTYRSRHRLGHWIWIEAGIALSRPEGGGPPGLICSLRDVTERRRAEAAVAASEARYRLLADHSSDMIAQVDLACRRVFVSPASRRLLGYEPGELVGTRPQDFAHPEDVPHFQAMIDTLLAGRAESGVSTHRLAHKAGGWVWVEGSWSIVRNTDGVPTGFVASVRSAQSRRLAEEALRTSEARFRLLAENTSELVILGHDDGRKSYVSPAVTRLLGFMPDELAAMRLRDYVHPDDLEALYVTTRRLNEGSPEVSIVYRARHKSGAWVWVEGVFRRVADARSDEPTIVATFRDVSERKAQAQALGEAKEVAEAALAAAEHASRSKSDFLASMSHEIRTPLNGIIGYTDLLLGDRRLDSDVRRHVERIGTSGAALLTIVNDVLDFSKIEAGKVDLDPRPFDLTGLVEGATSIVAGMAELKGLELSSRLEGKVPARLVGDEDRLRQILLNLLNNAVKFTGAGSVALRTEGLIEADGAMRLRFSVTDSGIGVPVEKRDRLFRRFSQADGAVGRSYGGTGLGLAISKSLVELMGGTIGMDSAAGGGSVFWFSIKLPVEAKRPFASVDRPTEPSAVSARTILLVDDFAINRDLGRAVLESVGHEVDVVSGGVEAVRAVQEKIYDLVLMDVQMPDLDGLAATRIIRALEVPARDVPIVAMTANVLPSQIAEILQCGMNAHVGKPFRQVDLHAAVEQWAAKGRPDPCRLDAGLVDMTIQRQLVALIGPASFARLLRKLDSAIDEHLDGDRLRGTNMTRLASDAHALISISGMLGFMGLSQACARLAAACKDNIGRQHFVETVEEHSAAVRKSIMDLLADGA